jgi:hypothetical protein
MTLSARRALVEGWMADLPPSARPIPLDVYRAHIDRVLTEYAITVEWRLPCAMPRGAAAFADRRRRHIVCPPITSEVDVAIALHEAGHCLAEPCRGGLHRPNRAVKDWHHCIRCETLAWALAGLLIRPLRWTTPMHARLAQSLEHYRQRTPASAEALGELARLTSNLGRASFRQAALEAELKGDR